MVSHLVFYQLGLIALVSLFLICSGLWPSEPVAARPMPPKPLLPRGKHSKKPTPFPGLTRKPSCAACAQAIAAPRLQPSPPPPPTVTSTRGRRRHVDTSDHFCPDPDCRYGGWLGLGNITSNGHPSGGPWRQLYCGACHGYFLETHGTPLHGKRVAPEKLVWAVGALAEGLGIRAVARVFEVDPNTVLAWLVEVADHAVAFSQYFLHDVRVTQVQLDELFALLSAVKAGKISEAKAIQRLSRSPHWVWTAIDPASKLLLAIDIGDRTLAMAQSVVHQVVQVLAPGCVPLFLTDGFTAWCLAPWRPSMTSWPHWAGTSTRPSWSGSTSPSGSMSPRSGDGSAPYARAKTGCGSSWPFSIATTISVCLMRAYAYPCCRRSSPIAAARPHSGSRGRRRWRRGSPTMSGRCARCCSFASHRGPSQQGCEHTAMVGSDQGSWSPQATCVCIAGCKGVTRGRGPLKCHNGPMDCTFLLQ